MQCRRSTAQIAVAFALVTAGLMAGTGVGDAPTARASAGNAAAAGSFAGRVGVSSHLVWISEAESFPLLEQAANAGISWIREDFPWRIIEPARGSFNWTNTDGLMAAAARAGVHVLAIFGQTPSWARSGDSSSYPPNNPADYANFVRAVLLRYGAGGSFWASRPELVPRPLSAVELWNEPWGYWAWKPNPDPGAYARLVRAAVPAIRSVRPETTVLISGDYWQTRTEGPARRWLQELLAVDPTLNRAVNAYSIHPYPDPKEMGPTRDAGDPSFTFAGQIRLARETDPSLPIWVTEVGWSTASTSDSVSEATQASYVREATRRAIEELNVARFFNYMLRDTDGTSREDRFGLRRADGSAKAAWDSLAALLSSPTSGTSSTTTAPSNTTTTTSAQTTTTSGTTTASPATTYGNGKAKGKQKDAQSPRLSFLSLRARVTRPLAVKRVPRSIRLSPGHRKPTLSLPSRRLTLWGRVRTKGSAVSTRGLKVSIYLRRAHGWRFLGARRIRARGRFGLSAPFFGRAKVLRVRVVIRGSDGPAGSRVRTIAVRR